MNPLYHRLEGLEVFGAHFGLERIRAVLSAMGNPQDAYPSVLIAGTNGKGSVGAMLSAVLSGNGLKTGYYTSPHLVHPCERMSINGIFSTPQEFEEALSAAFSAIDRIIATLDQPPTYFETVTAAAFWWFRKIGIEIAVVEVGLGGRFDATNVIHQKVSVITTIGFDHEMVLGETLGGIAEEKAGIIKPGSVVITGGLPPAAADVVQRRAQETATPLQAVGPAQFGDVTLEEGFPVFTYKPWNRRLRVNLRGRHQAHNAAVALAACDALAHSAIHIDREQAVQALDRVYWPGRLEMLQVDPAVLVDCAHNPMGARSLADFITDMKWGKCTGLFTAMKDKKIEAILREMGQMLESLFVTRVPPVYRCAPREQLEQACNSVPVEFTYVEEPAAALDQARSDAKQAGSNLVVFGSMYLVGEVFRLYGKS